MSWGAIAALLFTVLIISLALIQFLFHCFGLSSSGIEARIRKVETEFAPKIKAAQDRIRAIQAGANCMNNEIAVLQRDIDVQKTLIESKYKAAGYSSDDIVARFGKLNL